MIVNNFYYSEGKVEFETLVAVREQRRLHEYAEFANRGDITKIPSHYTGWTAQDFESRAEKMREITGRSREEIFRLAA